MANTTLNQFLQEQTLVASMDASGLTEEVKQQEANGEWSPALTADELFEALESGNPI